MKPEIKEKLINYAILYGVIAFIIILQLIFDHFNHK